MSYFETFQFTISGRTATLCNNGTHLSRTIHRVPGLLRNVDGCLSKTVGIDHAVFTNSFYVVNESNDVLALQVGAEGDPDAQPPRTVRWTKGNYTAATFIVMAKHVMGDGWEISVDPTTGVMTFLNYAFPAFRFLGAQSTCQTLLGMPYEADVPLVSDAQGVLHMPYPCNFMGAQSLVLRSGSIPCQNLDSTGMPFLANIPITSAPYEQTYYTNVTRYGCAVPVPTVLDQWEMNIDDEFGNAINFNNTNWVVTLFATYEYAQPAEQMGSLTELFKHYMTQNMHVHGQGPKAHKVTSNALVEAAAAEKKRKLEDMNSSLT